MLICYWTKWSDDVANGGAYYMVLQWVVGDLVQQLIVKCVILGALEEKTATTSGCILDCGVLHSQMDSPSGAAME